MRLAVIGAGPAGWATTNRLVSMGHNVTVFTTDINDSHPSFVDQKLSKNLNGAKLLHGSNYPYRELLSYILHLRSPV